MVIITSCSTETQYVCSDGSIVEIAENCNLQEVESNCMILNGYSYCDDDLYFLQKITEFETEWSQFNNERIEKSVYLMFCEQDNFCIEGETIDSQKEDYLDFLEFNIEKCGTYKTRFELYKLSEKYEPLRQDYIEGLDLIQQYYNEIIEKVNNGNLNSTQEEELPSFNELLNSRKAIIKQLDEVTEDLELSNI